MLVNPFTELPLAIFTTFVPLAVGAFAAIGLLWLDGRWHSAEQKGRVLAALAPLVLLVIGLIGAFFHLKSPLYAIFSFVGLPTSPLSQEILAAVLFLLVAAAFCTIVLKGKAEGALARALLVVGIVLGVVLCVFTGLAYSVETIPSWSSAWTPVSMVGYMLSSFAAGACVASFKGMADDGKYRACVAVMAVIGFAIAGFAVIAHLFEVSGMFTALTSGSALAAAALPYACCGIALLLVGAVASILAVGKDNCKVLYAIAFAAVAVGIFLARLAFYCMQMGVGF